MDSLGKEPARIRSEDFHLPKIRSLGFTSFDQAPGCQSALFNLFLNCVIFTNLFFTRSHSYMQCLPSSTWLLLLVVTRNRIWTVALRALLNQPPSLYIYYTIIEIEGPKSLFPLHFSLSIFVYQMEEASDFVHKKYNVWRTHLYSGFYHLLARNDCKASKAVSSWIFAPRC